VLCTTLIQTARQQLTLFHAVSALQLLSMLGYAISIASFSPRARGWRRRDPRGVLRCLLRAATVAVYIGLWLYVLLHADDFGSQPGCNAQTTWMLLGYNLGLESPAVISANMLVCFLNPHQWGLLGALATAQGIDIPGSLRKLRAARSRHDTAVRRGDPEPSGMLLSDRAYRLGAACANSAVQVFMVVGMEQSHASNRVAPEEQQWTFGQVLAMFLMLGVVWEVMDVGLTLLDGDGDVVLLGEVADEELDGV
jgi:hypothetical protein